MKKKTIPFIPLDFSLVHHSSQTIQYNYEKKTAIFSKPKLYLACATAMINLLVGFFSLQARRSVYIINLKLRTNG